VSLEWIGSKKFKEHMSEKEEERGGEIQEMPGVQRGRWVTRTLYDNEPDRLETASHAPLAPLADIKRR
jgi:hypothetical protein